MKKHLLTVVCTLLCACLGMKAQQFTTSPTPLQEDSPNVVITFHADANDAKYGKPFLNATASTQLYAHIGVKTTLHPDEWSHVKTAWSGNTAANKFTYKSANTWELNIGDLRTYFNTNSDNDPLTADEKITAVCIIARNAGGSLQTQDVFIPVVEGGFQLQFTSNAESTVLTSAQTISFTASTTRAANIEIKVNSTSIGSAANATTLTKSHTFSAHGSYNVVATATSGSETLTQSISILYPQASPQGTYPGGVPKMGAVRAANGDVTFCLAAPGKSSVLLIPSWDNYQTLDKNVMKYQDYNGNRYFWVTVSGLDPDRQYPYYYLVDGSIAVGDPYANLVLNPNSDKWLRDDIWPARPKYPYGDVIHESMLAVYHANQDAYDWKVKDFEIPDPRGMVIYEMLFRDFTGTDKTDDGTIRKAIEKIPYLRDLGVNAVELMPVMEFDGNNSWGYNTNFYMALDKSYGSPDDLKEFIDLCHQNGIAVILDIVFNQSAGLHPWYMMYPAASNPFYNATAPHDYSVLNDWKQDNELVKQHWDDAIRYWMTAYKVDGFRFDLVKGLGDNASYGGNTEKYNQTRVNNMTRLHATIKSVNPKAIHINEFLGTGSDGMREEIAYGADGQLCWNNQNYNSVRYASGEKTNADLQYYSSAACSRTKGIFVSYAESHDEERMGYYQRKNGTMKNASHADRMKRLGSVAPWLILTPDATPMIWAFAELGADEGISENGDRVDAKKVVWSYMDDADRMGVHDNYKHLIHLRKDNPEIFCSDATVFTNNFSNNSVCRYMRFVNGDREIVALINPSTTASATVSVSNLKGQAQSYQVVTATKDFTPNMQQSQGNRLSVSVPKNSFVVFASPSVSATEDIAADSAESLVNVRAEGGNIIVDGDWHTLQVCDLMGRAAGTTGLAPGIYIVTVDGHSVKIAVR